MEMGRSFRGFDDAPTKRPIEQGLWGPFALSRLLLRREVT